MKRSEAKADSDLRDVRLFEAMGGTAGCRALSTAFYARVAQNPVLRPLFPGKSFKCAIEALAAYLVQLLGGPPEDAQRRWWVSLRESHARFRIGAAERQAWMAAMVLALDDVAFEEPVRDVLLGMFERTSGYIAGTHEEAPALDRAVAAIRCDDAEGAMALAEGRNTSTLLAVMIEQGGEALVAYVRLKLEAQPELVGGRFGGRTLLHVAAAAGCLSIVESLLRLGADADVQTDLGHTPLYCAANGGGTGDVVRALIRAGARVDACDGVQRCTPLHMAARRGNVEVAEALLQCGASIGVRDRRGDTPLRRAEKCRKPGVEALLRSHGG